MCAKILLLLALVIVCYTLALSISMLNEHFDRSHPHHISATVDSKFTRHNPFPVDVLGVRLEEGRHVNVAVLKEIWDKTGIGSRLELVEKRGLLGKTWSKTKHFTRVSKAVAHSKAQYTSVCCSYLYIFAPADIPESHRDGNHRRVCYNCGLLFCSRFVTLESFFRTRLNHTSKVVRQESE